jgi:hypothetical protein
MTLPAGLGHRCTPDLCLCPDCGAPLWWLPGTARHMCRQEDCYWLQRIRTVQTITSDLL